MCINKINSCWLKIPTDTVEKGYIKGDLKIIDRDISDKNSVLIWRLGIECE